MNEVNVIEKGRERQLEGPMTGWSVVDWARTLWFNRKLLAVLVRRDIDTRYRGSAFGLSWLVITPALLAVAYTYIFGVVFKGGPGAAPLASTWVGIYMGTAIFQLFAEPTTRSASLIHDQSSFVKKIAVPLRILPAVPVCTSLLTGCVAISIPLAFQTAMVGFNPALLAAVPCLLIPLFLATLGVAWGVSAAAAYIRDLRHVVAFAMTMLLFFTPVFYPVASVPERFRWLVLANPVAYAVEAVRSLSQSGSLPEALPPIAYLAACLALCAGGYAIYRRAQEGFADVV